MLKGFHHCWTSKRGYTTQKFRNMGPKLHRQSQYLIFTTPSLPPEHGHSLTAAIVSDSTFDLLPASIHNLSYRPLPILAAREGE